MERHQNYRLDCRLNGVWFDSRVVFPTQEEAARYGSELVCTGSIKEYALVPTDEPVHIPRSQRWGSEPEPERMLDISDLFDALLDFCYEPLIGTFTQDGATVLTIEEHYFEHEEVACGFIQ